MHALRDALRARKLSVEAVDAPINDWDRLGELMIVYLPPFMETRTESGEKFFVGHYVVIRPLSAGTVQVLDFPGETPRVVEIAEIRKIWLTQGVRSLPALILTPSVQVHDPAVGEQHEAPPTASVMSESLARGSLRSDAATTEVAIGTTDLDVSSKLDCGPRKHGDLVQFVIRLTNAAAEALTLTSRRADCGCVVVPMARQELKSGEGVDIPGTISLAGRVGRVVQHVRVEYEVGNIKHSADVGIEAEVVIPWMMVPPAVDVGKVAGGEAVVRYSVKMTAGLRVDENQVPETVRCHFPWL